VIGELLEVAVRVPLRLSRKVGGGSCIPVPHYDLGVRTCRAALGARHFRFSPARGGAEFQFMSMIMEYVRLRPHELVELRRLLIAEPDSANEYAGDLRMGDEDEAVSSRGMDTDTAWAGLRWLLAKLDPPVDVIGGGQRMTDDEWGYDSPRLLAAADVADAARFLAANRFATLAEHYAAAELTAAEVYPGIWDQDWALSYLEDAYGRLVALFCAAAADHEPIAVWMA
jgi:hypothetical protein